MFFNESGPKLSKEPPCPCDLKQIQSDGSCQQRALFLQVAANLCEYIFATLQPVACGSGLANSKVCIVCVKKSPQQQS